MEKVIRSYFTKTLQILLIMLLFIKPVLAGEMEFLRNLSDKPKASNEDGVRMVLMLVGKYEDGIAFQEGLTILRDSGYFPADRELTAEEPLRKGNLALMIARFLEMRGGIFYRLFKNSGRYAFRECVFAELMAPKGSEYDRVGGGELLSIIERAWEYGEEEGEPVEEESEQEEESEEEIETPKG